MKYKKRLRACEGTELMKPGVGHIVLHSKTSLKGREMCWLEVHPEGFDECYKFETASDILGWLIDAPDGVMLREICRRIEDARETVHGRKH